MVAPYPKHLPTASPASPRISRSARDWFGWIAVLLLLAHGGCRAPAPTSSLASALSTPNSIKADETRIANSAKPTTPDSHPSVIAANYEAPECNPSCSAEGSIQLASFEIEPPYSSTRPLGPLRLEDAVNLALERNPDLVAARAGEPVAHAAFHVAETYPWNPQFQTQVLPYNRDRDGNYGSVSQQYSIMQTLELAGQKRFRMGAATANWDQVDSTIRQAELTNVAQTTRLFFAVLYQRDLRDMSRSLADLNEQLVGVLQRQERAGRANYADVELGRLQAQTSRRQSRLADANYQAALMNLRNQLNLDAHTPLDLARRWMNWRWRPFEEVISDYLDCGSAENTSEATPRRPDGDASRAPIDDAMLRQLIADRPDIVAAHAAVALAEENLQLANAMRRPDLQVGPMWQRDETATEFWGIQAQMDIPFINTGASLVGQRIAEWEQQQITAAQLENRAVLEARAALERYERARRNVDQSRGDFGRAFSDSLKPFEDQFNAGQIPLIQVFAAHAAFVQSRQGFLELMNELALAAAEVTQATSVAPWELVTDIEPLPCSVEEWPLP